MKKSFNISLIIRITIWVLLVISFCLLLFPINSFMEVVNKFAYFTNLSNMFVLILETVLIFKTFKHIKKDKQYVAKVNSVIHLFVLFTISLTMIVFTGLMILLVVKNAWAILSVGGRSLFSEIVFHYIVPILFIIDYIFFVKHGSIGYKKAKDFCFYCICYFLALVLRAQTHTLLHDVPSIGYKSYYPYPFIDINNLGVAKSVISIIICVVGFYVYSLVLIYNDNKLAKKRKAQTPHV